MRRRLAGCLVVSFLGSSCGLGSVNTASQSGSTTLGVSLQADVVTITQDLTLQSTVPLTSYAQGRLLYNPPSGGVITGTLLEATAVQHLATGDRPLRVALRSNPAGLTLTGMLASHSEHLQLIYRVSGLVHDAVLVLPTPGSVIGRWSRVEVDVDAPARRGDVSIAAGSRTEILINKATSGGWQYVLGSVPGGSPAVTLTTLH